MTFKDVAVRNFKANIKKYTSYLLCSSFAIMMFFIYSTLLFNKQIKVNGDDIPTSMVFVISLATIALFSIIFINYAHTAFIKSRYREFGLYLTLGMTKRDIRKIIVLENCLIALVSSLVGLAAGLVFSRLFQMMVAGMLKIDSLDYSMSLKSFVLTLAVFTAIFSIVIIISMASTKKLEISEMLKESRKAGKSPGHGFLQAVLGITILAASLVFLFIFATNKSLNSNLYLIALFTISGFTSIYLIISSFGGLLQWFMKRNNSLYYGNMLVVTEINYKFRQNKKVLFILSILSSMIVFFMASPFSLYSLSENIATMSQKTSIEYAELSGVNSITPEKLESIVRSGKLKVTSKMTTEFLQLSCENGRHKPLENKPVISASAYNSFFKASLSVPEGKAINVISTWIPGYKEITPSSKIVLTGSGYSREFTVKASVKLPWLASATTYPCNSGIVLNDKDYAEIKGRLGSVNIGKIHSISVKDWMKTGETVKSLRSSLAEANKKSGLSGSPLARTLKIGSTIEAYNGLKQSYSLFIFVMSFLGLLFFISAGSVLYFKQYTELAADREKYRRLFKIGIRAAEVKKVVSRELALTFFTPLVLGSIMGYSFIFLVTHIVGGEGIMREFMMNSTKVVIAYFLFQSIFYLITRRKYSGEVIGQGWQR